MKYILKNSGINLYVGLSNENIGENPMPRKPKVSSAKGEKKEIGGEGWWDKQKG